MARKRAMGSGWSMEEHEALARKGKGEVLLQAGGAAERL